MKLTASLRKMRKFSAPYRGSVTLAVVAVSVVVGLAMIYSSIERDEKMLRFIGKHIASLVEAEDRPEIQRLLRSAVLDDQAKLFVVEDGVVFGSSASVSDLGQPYRRPKTLHLVKNGGISLEGLITTLPIHQENGSELPDAVIVMVTPLYTVLIWAIGMALLALNIGLFLGCKWADTLSEKKAKELAAEAYKRLIHDLHNPVAALRMSSRLAFSSTLSESERREASANVPVLAEQILNQVRAANQNLEFDTVVMRSEDVRDCILGAISEARLASSKLPSVSLDAVISNDPISIPHDSRLLRRAVSNLVKNALDACESKVQVAVVRTDRETVIQVDDDGPGLSQEAVALYLVGRGKSTKADRQARGLATTNHIARAHGGRIVYRPSILGGGCFEIKLQG